MSKKNLNTALAIGGAAAVLVALKKKQTTIPSPPLDLSKPAAIKGATVGGTAMEDANYWTGFMVGAGSALFAWYVWSQARPKLRRFTAPPMA